MLEGLVGLLLQAEISKAQIEVQDSVDSYYVAKADSATGHVIEVTYDVNSRGEITGDLEEFRNVVAETLSDSRGWVRANVKFTEVENGGRLHMVLAAPAEVAAASSGCSDKLSCTVKPYVAINDNRWMGATDTYNNAGETLLNYRRMVLNHETGHWLGHDHLTSCSDYNNLAPIMMQQSIDLRGCSANPWPLNDELWTRGV